MNYFIYFVSVSANTHTHNSQVNGKRLFIIIRVFLILFFFFQKFMVLGWIVGPLLLVIMIFGPTKKELSPIAIVLYTSFGKTAWALGIAWFIIACATGRGGIVNRILSAKCLLPYSRMTYTAYLINPLCIMFVVMSCEAPIRLDYFSLVQLLFSVWFVLIDLLIYSPCSMIICSSSIVQVSRRSSFHYRICLCCCLKIHSFVWESCYKENNYHQMNVFGCFERKSGLLLFSVSIEYFTKHRSQLLAYKAR